MKAVIHIFMALGISSVQAANDSGACASIRAEIQAQNGILASPNVDLLRKVGTHRECRFSSAEVYRAAYGDKPMPARTQSDAQDSHSDHKSRRHHDDDDD